MKSHVAVLYDIGARAAQEDSYVFARLRRSDSVDLPDCIVVADGMGGHDNGEIAAHVAANAFYASSHKNIDLPPGDAMEHALHEANNGITLARKRAGPRSSMGCTLLGVDIRGGRIRWISVGDSMLLQYRDGVIRRLNDDHSMAGRYAKLVKRGELSQEDAERLGGQNKLLSALMGDAIDIIDDRGADDGVELLDEDIIIVASDGLATLSTIEIAQVVRQNRPDATQIRDGLFQAIRAAGKPNQDNVTAIVYRHKKDANASEIPFLLRPSDDDPAYEPWPSHSNTSDTNSQNSKESLTNKIVNYFWSRKTAPIKEKTKPS